MSLISLLRTDRPPGQNNTTPCSDGSNVHDITSRTKTISLPFRHSFSKSVFHLPAAGPVSHFLCVSLCILQLPFLQARITGAVPRCQSLPHQWTEGQRAVPWENRRSWSFGNCAAVVGAAVTSPAGASAAAEGLGGESATQGGGGCACAGASTAGEESLLCLEDPASGSC